MKKSLIIILIILLIIILLFGGIVYFVLNKLNKINYINIPREQIQVTEGVEENLKEYRNVVLLGIDTREDTYLGSRADCIIIASINEEKKQIKLLSVYRDTYLEIPGYGLDNVNHSYAYNGPALTMSTLNTNLDLDITEFVTVNFESTKEIINQIGGVEITVTNAEATRIPGISTGGTYNLTGEQALAYGRIRKIDNDYVRTERMRTIVTAVFEKAKHMSIAELNELADKILPEIYTNVTRTEILSMIPKIATYSIVDSKGWPYEVKAATLEEKFRGVPVTLQTNVEQLHKELFADDEYVVTDKVKEINEKIINKTGYR